MAGRHRSATMIGRVLRGVAIAIAAAGVTDPACQTETLSRPTLSVEIVDTPSMALPAHASRGPERPALQAEIRRDLAERVRRTLSERLATEFDVVSGPDSAAISRVVISDRVEIGDQLWREALSPAIPTDNQVVRGALSPAIPTHVVSVASVLTPNVRIASIDAPRRITAWDSATIVARLEGRGLTGTAVDVRLLESGVELAKTTHRWRSETDAFDARLTFIPGGDGVHRLEVVASNKSAERTDLDNRASALVEVEPLVRRVLVYQPRPSWMAAFAARALEDDPRLELSSLVRVSKGIEVTAEHSRSERQDEFDPFDAVVVGAPEALTSAEVARLHRYATLRGGSVILLGDRKPAGPVAALLPGGDFEDILLDRPVQLDRGLRASELSVPKRVHAGWEPLAADGKRGVLFAAPLGRGHILFSGALDAWRYREGSRYWRDLIATFAAKAPSPVSVRFEPAIARPRDAVEVVAELTGRNLDDVVADSTTLTAQVAGSAAVRLWPGGEPGVFRGSMRAPAAEGPRTVSVEHDGARATATLVVDSRAAGPLVDDEPALEAFAEASGGIFVRAIDVERLAAQLRQRAEPRRSTRTVRPMRSAWWILPFAGCLAAEWTLRRRRHLH